MSRRQAAAWLRRPRHEVRRIVVAVGTAPLRAQQGFSATGTWCRHPFSPFGVAVAQQVDQRVFAVYKLYLACAAAKVEVAREVGWRQWGTGSATFECNQGIAVRRKRQRAEVDSAPVFAEHVGIIKTPAYQRLRLSAAVEQLDKIRVVGAAALTSVAVDLRDADAAPRRGAIGMSPGKRGRHADRQDCE